MDMIIIIRRLNLDAVRPILLERLRVSGKLRFPIPPHAIFTRSTLYFMQSVIVVNALKIMSCICDALDYKEELLAFIVAFDAVSIMHCQSWYPVQEESPRLGWLKFCPVVANI
jgi:hypothetical protein